MGDLSIPSYVIQINKSDNIPEIIKKGEDSYNFKINLKCMNKDGSTTPKLNNQVQLYSEACHRHTYSCNINLIQLQAIAHKKKRIHDINKMCKNHLVAPKETFYCLNYATRKSEVVEELSSYLDACLTSAEKMKMSSQ